MRIPGNMGRRYSILTSVPGFLPEGGVESWKAGKKHKAREGKSRRHPNFRGVLRAFQRNLYFGGGKEK